MFHKNHQVNRSGMNVNSVGGQGNSQGVMMGGGAGGGGVTGSGGGLGGKSNTGTNNIGRDMPGQPGSGLGQNNGPQNKDDKS